jgi:hypothetical protein
MVDSKFQLHGSGEDEQVAAYRPVSRLAVIALITGLLSAVAAVSIYFIWLPLVPILTGVAALYQIHKHDSRVAGRWAAVTGLALGSLFVGFQAGRLVHSYRVANVQARHFADGWLRLLVEGLWQAADQGTLPRARRILSPRTVVAGYEADLKLQKQWQDFIKGSPVCQTLLDGGPQTQIRFVRVLQQHFRREQRAVQLLYEVAPSGREPLQIAIWVVRDEPRFDHPAAWWAQGVQPWVKS